jgi:hypothetical protein
LRKGVPRICRSTGGVLLFIILLLAQAVGTAAEKRSGTVVRVTYLEAPVAGARVEWRNSPDAAGIPPAVSGATDDRGNASFDLSPGRYFLVVHWRRDADYSRPMAPGDRFAYFGGNPVYAAPGPPRDLYVGLEEFLPADPPVPAPPGGTGVAGRVTAGGSPVPGVTVGAYLRTETAFRDLGFAASAPTAEDGSFLLDLPPGNYYLVARKRASGAVAGPLRKGDRFGYYPANPVSVAAGLYAQVTIPVTSLKMRNTPAWSGEYEAASSIEGRILDAGGRPRKGVYAALYDNPDLLNRPVFLSDVTGEDGRYRLPVPVAGRYHLGARSGYGGSPAPGDLYGRYEGNPDHSVTVKEGDRLTGIDIVVNEVW